MIKKLVKQTTAIAVFFSLTWPGLSLGSSLAATIQPLPSNDAQVKVINYMLSLLDFSNTLGNQGRLNYCTLNYALGKNSDYLSKVEFNQQPVKLIHIQNYNQANGQCHTLHFTDAKVEDYDTLLEFFHNQPILLISEGPDFARMGGHISLFKLHDKHAFTFNIPSIESAGFEVNLGKPNQLIVEPPPNEY